MTDAEVDALEAGAELDKLVDKAIDGDENCVPFRPSSDWNDAMWAAEKARLFYPDRFLDFDYNGEWRVQELDMCTPEARVITSHKNGPVAICCAILKAVKK